MYNFSSNVLLIVDEIQLNVGFYKRGMRQFNTIMAYLIPSPFRIKADRIFNGLNFTVMGNTVSCHVEFIASAYLLRAKRLSHVSFRSPICRDYVL